MLEYWKWTTSVWDVWLTERTGPDAVHERQNRRLAEIVQFARQHSRFYQKHYAGLPLTTRGLADLPPVDREALMSSFDDWVTDDSVTRSRIDEFLREPECVGHPYARQYSIWTSSGTTGIPGVYLHDNDALAVYDALQTVRFWRAWGAENPPRALLGPRLRYAMVAATGGHFAGASSIERLRLLNPLLADNVKVFSVQTPIAELVEKLNEYQPAYLASYPTTMEVLANEQRAGRLNLRLAAIWTGGECLSPSVSTEIESAFHCGVLEEYGSSEFMSIGSGCKHNWLHVNADWVILEPVDANYQPVPPGQTSHTVLLTNLANRIQPLIRYDLGDSVVVRPDRCECGNFLPAVRVEGRRDAILHFQGKTGGTVQVLPLALTTVVEEGAGVHRFQLIQDGPDSLCLRLDMRPGDDGRSMRTRVEGCVRSFLSSHGLPDVVLKYDPQPPLADVPSGKFRQVSNEWQP
jgi:phenylacetate-CoA ligase